MQLETYISDLLYRYECVTIPDFGSFLSQRVSASIDDITHTFHAPKKVLSFNEQIQKNDGLLAHYIADIEKIPFEAANQKIAKRVKLIKSYLTEGEVLTFKAIGEIRLNNEGKILFEPTYQLNYLTDSFGLSPVVTREVYKKEVEAIENVIPISITPEKRKSRPYLRYAAVAMITLTLGGFGASKYYANQVEAHNQMALEEATQKLETKIQQATFSLNPLPAVTLNVSKQTGHYHVVAGAFRIEENSIKKVKQLKALGFKARVLGLNKSGLYEVVYGSFETGKEALKAVRDIRVSHNKDAWIKIDTEISIKKENIKSVTTPRISENKEAQIEYDTINETVTDFTSNNESNLIQIVRNVENAESAFYLVLGNFNTVEKRDAFLTKMAAKGIKNTKFFYHNESGMYFIYQQKYDHLNTVQEAQKAYSNSNFERKTVIVKVSN
ncbi:SPOR domain-containing protein [Tamlana fucoidanivorans]|uniref:SPOR domain-containing protein n=1 Tax=Allotamlana fucoidanivorans TaxID=2583814 RepID=A0A5C4SSP4_9FLAO|nr:SPOR domain-containing protein [Tamlana fucoidanivorans]TNJ47007.1 SPOR domain-containing protein [Tamlana fucoidanivorans]